jgi:hypothetical protein
LREVAGCQTFDSSNVTPAGSASIMRQCLDWEIEAHVVIRPIAEDEGLARCDFQRHSPALGSCELTRVRQINTLQGDHYRASEREESSRHGKGSH